MSVQRTTVVNRMGPLKRLARKSPGAWMVVKEKAAIQLMTWMNAGSPNESRKPPIKTGELRGSSTAFVGSKKVGQGPSPSEGSATPAQSSENSNPDAITVVYNTDYAAKMHEHQGGWGEYTEQDGDAGNKWIERHMRSDEKDLFKFMARLAKKELRL